MKKLILVGLILVSFGLGVHSMAGMPGCRITFGTVSNCSGGLPK